MDSHTVKFFKGFRYLTEEQEPEMIYTSRWKTYGQFELTLPQMAPYIALDNLILWDSDPRKNGVIKYIKTADDGTVTIKGFSLLWWLTDRIILPDAGQDYAEYNASVEDILVDLVRKNAVSCADPARQITGLTLEASQGRGDRIAYQNTYGNLLDALVELSAMSGLGIGIYPDLDKQQYVFEVREGTDWSAGQAENPPTVFRRSYGNIQKAEYILNDSTAKTTAYVAGQGEGATRTIYVEGAGNTGTDRREIFVDARDVEDAAGLPDRGRTKLSELTPQESFEVTVTSEWYKRRWDLGDIVTVIDEDTGLTLTERITEVEEAQDASGYEAVPTMGVPESTSSGISSGTSSGGGGGGDLTYTHTQLQPAEVWTIEHNLGKHPSVTVADSAGSVVMGDVEYLDRNTVQVTFMAAFAGTAHLN